MSEDPTLAQGELQLEKPEDYSKTPVLTGRLSKTPEDRCLATFEFSCSGNISTAKLGIPFPGL